MVSFPDDVIICVVNIIELSHAPTHTHTPNNFQLQNIRLPNMIRIYGPWKMSNKKKMKINQMNANETLKKCQVIQIAMAFFSHRQPKARPVLSTLPSLFLSFSFSSLSKHIETNYLMSFFLFFFFFSFICSFVSSL